MQVNALDLFLKQRRFDLIFKYLYAKDPSPFAKAAYLENIRAFNNYHEECPSDGVPKNQPEDFITSFNSLIANLKENGYNDEEGVIPIGANGEIWDGGHRLSICAFLNYYVSVEHTTIQNGPWDYAFFRARDMRPETMDYGALEYVKLNPNAYIVNLQPITSPNNDQTVIDILNKYGFIYYCKSVWITYNGLVNLKKICYGSFWEKASWIGSLADGFLGAQDHANKSMGRNPMRVFVFVCDNLAKVQLAKKEIRDIYGIGNYSVHINDTHEEAVCLAENYFNTNTLFQLNTRPFHFYDEEFEEHIEALKTECTARNIDIDRVCGAGSTPMNVFHIRHSQDFDCLTLDEAVLPENEIISSHNKYRNNYPFPINEIISNPSLHMYYRGIKFISLETLYAMKKYRMEIPKDYLDCKRIHILLLYKKIIDTIGQGRLCRKEVVKIQSRIVLLLYKYNNTLGCISIKSSLLSAWNNTNGEMCRILKRVKNRLCK